MLSIQPKQVWRFLIPLFIVLSSLPKTNGEKTKEDLKDEVDHIKTTVIVWLQDADATKDPYKDIIQKIETVLGPIPKDRSAIDLGGLYGNFVQAWHPLMPAIRSWKLAYQVFGWTRNEYRRTRIFQKEYNQLPEITKACQKAVNDAEQELSKGKDITDNKMKELFTSLNDCKNENIVKQLDPQSGEFLKKAYTALYESFDVFLTELYYAVSTQYYLDYNKIDVDLFHRMKEDSTDFYQIIYNGIQKHFPDYINDVRTDPSREQDEADDLKEVLEHIKWRITQPPYDEIFDITSLHTVADDWSYHQDGVAWFFNTFSDLYYNGGTFNGFTTKDMWGWDYYKKDDWDVRFETFTEDYKNGVFDGFYNFVVPIYMKHLWVDPIVNSVNPMITDKKIGITYPVGDGEWNWQYSYKSGQSVVQNLRLAWDLLGALQEELKCYMRKTYYFDLRQKAIQDTQLNLKEGNGYLFSGISRTIFFPCRLSHVNIMDEEYDLVTKYCTRSNHEICAPMVPLDPRQRPDSPHHGGKSLLKPQWIYQIKDVLVDDAATGTKITKKRCVGRKDWALQLYQCRCGFRLDCGEDLGENITCQLQPNDLLRGQCRGSVGYPCKTLPLMPGKHHETCISGYCNMKKNSCEDEKYYSQTRSGAVSDWKIVKGGNIFGYLGLMVAFHIVIY